MKEWLTFITFLPRFCSGALQSNTTSGARFILMFIDLPLREVRCTCNVFYMMYIAHQAHHTNERIPMSAFVCPCLLLWISREALMLATLCTLDFLACRA